MTLIRVQTSQLAQASQRIRGTADMIHSIGDKCIQLGNSAPSYERQFGPVVYGMSAEAKSRSQAIESRLHFLADNLDTAGKNFESADQATAAMVAWLNQAIAAFLGTSPSPAPEEPALVELRYVSIPSLKMRLDPGLGGDELDVLPYGTALELVPGIDPIVADGYTWVQVLVNGQIGWVAIGPADGNGSFVGQRDPAVALPGSIEAAYLINPLPGSSLSGYDYGAVHETITVMVPALDANGNPLYDENGAPVMVPQLDANGNPVTYNTVHPALDISRSLTNPDDWDMISNTGGVIYYYQTADIDGSVQTVPYDPANPIAPEDLRWFGNYAVLETTIQGESFYQVFAHMDSFNGELEQGTLIPAGVPIGAMGNTGNSQGAHIHWEVRTEAGVAVYDNTGNFIVFYPREDQVDQYFIHPGAFADLLEGEPETPQP